MITTTTAVKPTACPECGEPLDSISGAQRPAPGDVTFCWSCTAGMMLTEDMGVRALTAEEKLVVEAHPQVQAMRRSILVWKAQLN